MSKRAQTEKPLPHSLDAEKAIVGAGILDNKAVLEAANYVKLEDFFLEQNRLIFTASQALMAEGRPVELVTLIDFLQKTGRLEAAGGAPYISAVSDGLPKVSNLKHYAAIVKEHSRRRAIIRACAELEAAAMDGAIDGEKVDAKALLQDGAGKFLSMMSEDGSDSMPSAWETAIHGALDEVIEEIRFPGNVFRWNFGIEKVDEFTAGWRRQDLNLLVGMTSHGKSLLAMQGAIQADTAGYKGLVFSAEMSKEALAKRELAHTASLPLYLLRRPEKIRNPEAIIQQLMEAALKERGRRILVVDRDIRPARVWSLCELVHRSSGLDFVIVDYDQLVVRAGLRRIKDDEFRAQAEFMADALALCKRLNICFVLLCQPRKVDDDVAYGKKPPRVEQIFGSSAVANTAHNILWIMRKYFTSGKDPMFERDATSHILKARNDRTGKVEHGFDPTAVLFTNEGPIPEAPKETKKQKQEREKREKEKKFELDTDGLDF